MKWRDTSKFSAVSKCSRYEIAGRYIDGYFAWRGRFVQTDELIGSSPDRAFVERRCADHASTLAAEEPA